VVESGAENLSKPDIAAAIHAAQTERTERTKVDQNWVVRRLQSIVERCMRTEAVLDGEGNPTGEYTFNAAGANKALELLGKHLGIFKEKVEVKASYVARIPPPAPDVATWLEECRRTNRGSGPVNTRTAA
jgi:phage terminase small subunit